MQFNKYVAIALLLVTMSSLHATVMQMDEFYHPELNQTVIFMHDAHFFLPDTDQKQMEAVMPVIRMTKASLISESRCPQKDPRIMPALATACNKEKLPVIFAECRDDRYSNMVYGMLDLLASWKTYKTIIAALKASKTSEQFGNSFLYVHKQNCQQVYNIIMPYVSSIALLKKDTHVNQLYLKQFDTLLNQANSTLNNINNWIYNQKKRFIEKAKSFKALTARLAKELILKKDDNNYSLNTQCIYQSMDSVTNSIFDINLLKELHQKRNERVIFVHAGAFHLRGLANQCLPHIGFELKHSISYLEKYREICATVASQEANVDTVIQSKEFKEFEQCAVDIEAFLKECTTLFMR